MLPRTRNFCESVVLASLILMLTACAPSLGSSIRLTAPSTPASCTYELENRLPGVLYQSPTVFDDRGSEGGSGIAEINGRRVEESGSLIDVTRRIVEEQIKSAGGTISLFDGEKITISIVQVLATVNPDFPMTRANTKVKLRMGLGESTQAVYQTSVDYDSPWISRAKVEELIGEAIAETVCDGLKDLLAITDR